MFAKDKDGKTIVGADESGVVGDEEDLLAAAQGHASFERDMKFLMNLPTGTM